MSRGSDDPHGMMATDKD